MLTDTKLLDLIYNAATCYVPSDELTEEQKERFDNITYRWCNCRRCKKALKISGKTIKPQYAGHCNKKTLQICLSKSNLKEFIELPYSMFLLQLIATAVHEIIHALFPEFDEEQTIHKTWEWLRRNEWVGVEEEFNRRAKAQFEKELETFP